MPTRETTEPRHRPAASPSSPPPPHAPLPERDVRRKRPPALSFLLRMDTLRRIARVVVAAGARLRSRSSWRSSPPSCSRRSSRDDARHVGRAPPRPRTTCRVRVPRHGAAVRPLRALRRARAAAGPVADRRVALPGHGRDAALRDRQRPASSRATTSSTGRSSSRSSTSSTFRWAYERVTGAPPARGRLPAPGGPRRLRRAHRGRRARAVLGRGRRADRGDRLHLADAAARQRPALARAPWTTWPTSCSTPPRRRGHHRRPRLPAEREAVELVDQCHQRGVAVRIAPSTMEILVHRAEFVPGQSVPLFELARRSSTASTTRSSARSTSSGHCCC